ncbi:hypothetical protein OROMI_003966 [Orobanche minor]
MGFLFLIRFCNHISPVGISYASPRLKTIANGETQDSGVELLILPFWEHFASLDSLEFEIKESASYTTSEQHLDYCYVLFMMAAQPLGCAQMKTSSQMVTYRLHRFCQSRKRKPGRINQSNPDMMQFRIDTINKKLESSEGLNGLDELVSGEKKCHGPGWLIGRHYPKCLKTSTQASAPAPTDSYMQELTKKIRQEVVVEVEAKLN